MSNRKTYNKGGNGANGENWVPKRRSHSYYQELEAAKSAEITIRADPKVIVKTNGEELPDTFRHFRDHFCQKLRQNAQSCGFTELRKVQKAALPYLDAGHTVHLATTARSGKSIGYMLPLIQKVHDDLKNTKRQWFHPRAIISCQCMEHMKFVYETICALVAGMGINAALFNGQQDEDTIEARKNADILVTTMKSMEKNLKHEKLYFSFLKYFVVEGTDGQLDSRVADRMILQSVFDTYDQYAQNSQMVLVSNDVSALELPFWKERVEKLEKSKQRYVVLTNDQRISPSNHVLIRSKQNDMPQVVLEAIKSYEKGQILIVIQCEKKDYEAKSHQIQQLLQSNEILTNIYDPAVVMRTKDIHFDDFTTGKIPVLIVRYHLLVRLLRFPNVKQVIHVSIVRHKEEDPSASYHYSSSIVSFVPRARSVIIFDVDDDRELYNNRMTPIVDAILDCTMAVDWPKNYVPMWVKKYYGGNDGLRKWDESDKNGINDLPDLWPVVEPEMNQMPKEPNCSQNNQIEYYDSVPIQNVPYDNDRQGPSGEQQWNDPQQQHQHAHQQHYHNFSNDQNGQQDQWNGHQQFQQPQQQYHGNWEGPIYQVQQNQCARCHNCQNPNYNHNNQQQYGGYGNNQRPNDYNGPREYMVYTGQNSGNWQNYQMQPGNGMNQQQNYDYRDRYDNGRPQPPQMGGGTIHISQNRNNFSQQEFNRDGYRDYGIDDGLQRMQISEGQGQRGNHPIENFHVHQCNQSNRHQVVYEPHYTQDRRQSHSSSQDVRAYQENGQSSKMTNPNIVAGNRFANRWSQSGQGGSQESPRHHENPQGSVANKSNPNIIPGNRFANRRGNQGNHGNR